AGEARLPWPPAPWVECGHHGKPLQGCLARERSEPGGSDPLAESAIPGAAFGDCAQPDGGGEGNSEGGSHRRSRQRMSTSVGRLEAVAREFRCCATVDERARAHSNRDQHRLLLNRRK